MLDGATLDQTVSRGLVFVELVALDRVFPSLLVQANPNLRAMQHLHPRELPG
jgi:hypothetical protein